MAVTVRVHLLGRMCVEADGRMLSAADLPGRQGRLVFAFLAAHQHPVARSELAAVLWGEELPDAWERHLSAVVSKLRSVLGQVSLDAEMTVESAFGSYQLRLPAGAGIDIEAALVALEDAEAAWRVGGEAAALAAADTAANLARRPFLPGEEGPWLESKRRELRAVLVRALEIETAILRGRGDHRYALRLAEEAVAAEPFRESSWAELMRVHLAAGNRAEGLRAYDRCRRLLAEELGVEPSWTTEAVFLELLRAGSGPA